MGQGEINLNELFSLDELAEILSSVGSDRLREIAYLVDPDQELGHLPGKVGPLINTDREKKGILTNRERDVLILASRGLTNAEIADKLCMSTSAVRMFLYRAFTKLGVDRKADAVQLALKKKEISVGEISSLDELENFLAPLGAESIEKMAQLLDEKLMKEPPIGS
jgi:DNA-binding CsgD family transcriptional regulator